MFGGYLIGCILLLGCGALGFPRVPFDMEPPLQDIDAPFQEQEALKYLMPRLAPRYAWEGVADPPLYVLRELKDLQDMEEHLKTKRRQLSIQGPIDSLREKLRAEAVRAKESKARKDAEKNREFLSTIGKRNLPVERSAELYDSDMNSDKQDFTVNERTF